MYLVIVFFIFIFIIYGRVQFDTKYYYEIGSGKWCRRFWFLTPPKSGPDVPYTFGLIGILTLVF